MNVNILSVKAMKIWVKSQIANERKRLKKPMSQKREDELERHYKDMWRGFTGYQRGNLYCDIFNVPFPLNLGVIQAFKDTYDSLDNLKQTSHD